MTLETRDEYRRRQYDNEVRIGEGYENESIDESEFSWGPGVEPPWLRFRPTMFGGRYRGTTPRYPNPQFASYPGYAAYNPYYP
jgi:hypothetical protein